MRTDIDITFDFRRDTPEGKDPDTYSKTLRRYHKLLWSKPLPCGAFFGLDDAIPGYYLYHGSTLGEFSLSSDAVIPTFKWNERIRTLIPEEKLMAFNAAGYTIGGMMVFPRNRIDGKWTINQARGCTQKWLGLLGQILGFLKWIPCGLRLSTGLLAEGPSRP
jgi:hypothetical protein